MNEIEILQRLERLIDLGLNRLDQAVLPEPDPALPVVIVLPGFMGVHLIDAAADRVWLDPVAGMRGDLAARWALGARDAASAFRGEHLKPDGLVRVVYADLLQALRLAGHVVHPLAFDFRQSLLASTLQLRDLVADVLERSPGARIVLVAHSMGSLVVSLLPYYLPAFADCIEQTILLGAPLGGSFDTVEAVTGTHWVLPRLVGLSPGETSLDFQASFATWPGVFSLLPDPEAFPGAGCERAFNAADWPARLAPRQGALDEARLLKTALRQSPLFRMHKPVTQLLATHYPSVASFARDAEGAITAGPRTSQGDGVVAAASALPHGVIGYRTMFPHTFAPAEPAAIQAVLDLIRTGECDLDPIEKDDLTATIGPGRAPEVQMVLGLMESGVTSMLGGCLGFSSIAQLLASMG
jgi:hypothetical protein